MSLKVTSFVRGIISWSTWHWIMWFCESILLSQIGHRVLSEYMLRKLSLIPRTVLLFKANIRAHCLLENNLLVKYGWGFWKLEYIFLLTLLCPLLTSSRYIRAAFLTFCFMNFLYSCGEVEAISSSFNCTPIASKSPLTNKHQSPGLGLFFWQVYTRLVNSLSDLYLLQSAISACLPSYLSNKSYQSETWKGFDSLWLHNR